LVIDIYQCGLILSTVLLCRRIGRLFSRDGSIVSVSSIIYCRYYRYRIVSAFLISVFFRYIVIVSVMNEISIIVDIFCVFLLSVVLNFKSNYNVECPHSLHGRTKRSNASSTAAYDSCTGESTNGGPVAKKRTDNLRCRTRFCM